MVGKWAPVMRLALRRRCRSVIASWPGCLSAPAICGADGNMDWTGAVRPTNQPAMEQGILTIKDTDRTTPHGSRPRQGAPKSAGPAHDTKSTGCSVWCNGCVCASIQASFKESPRIGTLARRSSIRPRMRTTVEGWSGRGSPCNHLQPPATTCNHLYCNHVQRVQPLATDGDHGETD